MAGFPPLKGTKSPVIDVPKDTGPTSVGKIGITEALKIKDAGSKGAPGAGPDKSVLEF